MIIDSHVHLGRLQSVRAEADATALLRIADRVGIDRIFCTSCTALFYDMVEGNREIASALREHPDRILGYATIPTAYWRQEALDELERCVDSYGMRGLKIYSRPHGMGGDRVMLSVNTPAMVPILERAAELRLPVLAHATPEECEALADEVPEGTLVMAHSGGTLIAGGNWNRAIEAARRYPNIYLDTCSSTVDMGSLEAMVEAVGPERIIFGTDTPMLDPFVQKARVTGAEISEEARALILGGNMERILTHPKQ